MVSSAVTLEPAIFLLSEFLDFPLLLRLLQLAGQQQQIIAMTKAVVVVDTAVAAATSVTGKLDTLDVMFMFAVVVSIHTLSSVISTASDSCHELKLFPDFLASASKDLLLKSPGLINVFLDLKLLNFKFTASKVEIMGEDSLGMLGAEFL